MTTIEHEQSGFKRFLASRVECPLCGDTDVDYEFVLDRVAFSLCPGCKLLFANPSATLRGAAKPAEPAPIRELLDIARRYSGRAPERCVVVSPYATDAMGGLPVRESRSFADDERFDTIVVLGAIEREEDPVEMLSRLPRHLEPGGSILLLAPSTASVSARRERSAWAPLRRGGRYFFSTDNLQLLATRCGLGNFMSFVDARDVTDEPSDSLTNWFRSHTAIVCRPVLRDERRLLSVIFPVYNEAATVEASLRRVLDKQIPGIDIEVVVVESNSTDGSREIVERYRGEPRVRLYFEERPRGKGHAVRTGLQYALGEVVLFQDADLEYDVEDYDRLVAPLFELRKNFVLGSRHNARGEAWKIRHFADQPGISTLTNVAHVALLAMFNGIYKQRLRDPFTMYKVFRRDCLFGLTFECNRFDFDYEINIKLLRKGYKPLEIPVNYESRSFKEGKKVSFFGDPPTWIRAMLKLRRAPLYASVAK
ncbi:MAG: glycosyltransferase [Candidatus Eremiobacteraeota bacterium]|nr:glycosyltransferase [Candidatus Eremiobacteraeota bacterium]